MSSDRKSGKNAADQPYFDSPAEARAALGDLLVNIVNSGLVITGIDRGLITVSTASGEDPTSGALASPSPGPDDLGGHVFAAVMASGYDGDVSQCCSTPAERRGTCTYCTSRGSSNGCS